MPAKVILPCVPLCIPVLLCFRPGSDYPHPRGGVQRSRLAVSGLFVLRQSVSYALRTASAVKNRVYSDLVIDDPVVNGIGKSSRQHALVMTKPGGMDAGTDLKRLDIRVKRIEKIASDSLCLAFIEMIAIHQITSRGRQYAYPSH